MPDGLHPSAIGLASLADCLLPLVKKLASGSAVMPSIPSKLSTAPVSSFQDRQGDEKTHCTLNMLHATLLFMVTHS